MQTLAHQQQQMMTELSSNHRAVKPTPTLSLQTVNHLTSLERELKVTRRQANAGNML